MLYLEPPHSRYARLAPWNVISPESKLRKAMKEEAECIMQTAKKEAAVQQKVYLTTAQTTQATLLAWGSDP